MVAYQDALDELTSCLKTHTLLDLARRFSETYKSLAQTSTEHFLVTPVTALPTGKEQGKFLAIDVGGSNLRVGFVELTGEPGTTEQENHKVEDATSTRIRRSHDKSWPIGDHLKMDQPEDLFGWIADCMAEVIREAINSSSISASDDILLGVTFSFPMAQTSLSEATLMPMGKGFAITSNLNLGEMLLAGYAPHCTSTASHQCNGTNKPSPGSVSLPKIQVAAITNDTVATFVSLAYAVKAAPNSRVAMGLIVGTGTNATIPMRPSTLHPEKQSQLRNLSASETVVINTEWTIRGTDEPLEALQIKTKWDRTLDAHSDAPGFQPFEYMTSGRYLGEIVRLAFADILHTTDTVPLLDALQEKNSLPTWFLAEILAHPRKRSVSVGPQSASDAYETLAYRHRRRRESIASSDGAVPEDLEWATAPAVDVKPDAPSDSDTDAQTEKRELFMQLTKPRVRYDVEVVTKLIVYTGIGWFAVGLDPILFELVGLGMGVRP
ncbi:hypothetical protein OPT61_g5029 [Boeremia exigua]|uniref:Uncharacterized protein n=1 Tax=Boeremia exigua TaxID=749465 RepID=A0ACC2IBZ4_9PLEO|nr:hypothetical protein OPT61_g5029 [Boeremia exigua]